MLLSAAMRFRKTVGSAAVRGLALACLLGACAQIAGVSGDYKDVSGGGASGAAELGGSKASSGTGGKIIASGGAKANGGTGTQESGAGGELVELGGAESGGADNNGGAGENGGAGKGSGGAGISGGGSANGGTPGTAGKGGGGTGGVTGFAGSPATAGSGGEGGCPAGVLGHCDAGATYPTYAGYTLALVEDFPVAIDLDKDPIFTWSDGSPSDGQTGFRKGNVQFASGKMILKAESDCPAKANNSACYPARTAYAEALSPNATANVGQMGVWSGELRSKYNNYRYGRYEVKFKAPVANPGQEGTDTLSGNYLSTMFVFRTPRNVVWNEIDIELEAWHHDHIAGNVVNATGRVGYPADKASAWDLAQAGGYAITQEHVYAFTWTPSSIDWYLDGVSIKSYAGTGAAAIPTLSTKIVMNLWVFGSSAAFGDGANNKFPFTAEYDYFRFYKLNSETKYPCSPTPACLDAADKTASAQNNGTEVNYGQ